MRKGRVGEADSATMAAVRSTIDGAWAGPRVQGEFSGGVMRRCIEVSMLTCLAVAGCGDPVVNLTGQTPIGDFAVHGSNAFVMEGSADGSVNLVQVPLDGSPTQTLVADCGGGYVSADDNFIYWVNSEVHALAFDGGTVRDVGPFLPDGGALAGIGAASDGTLYWMSSGDIRLQTAEIWAGSATAPDVAISPIAQTSGIPFQFAVSGGTLAWTDTSGIHLRAPGAGNLPILDLDGGAGNGPDRLTVDSSKVFWSEETGANSEVIDSAFLDGGSISQITTATLTRAIAVDGQYVYWRSPSCLFRAPLSGGPGKVIRKQVIDGFSLAVSSAGVIWSDTRGLELLRAQDISESEPGRDCQF